MNKKIFSIIAILVVLVILLFPKVISLNDGGTKIYKSLIYEITKAHKIREGGYLVEGTIIKVFGKQIYCDIPKDVKIIEDGKEKNEPNISIYCGNYQGPWFPFIGFSEKGKKNMSQGEFLYFSDINKIYFENFNEIIPNDKKNRFFDVEEVEVYKI